MADVIADVERLFHVFFKPDDFEVTPDGVRVRTGKFKTRGHTLSFNREIVWSLERHLELALPRGFGVCSLTAGQLRAASSEGTSGIDVVADPIESPDVDPLLGIPNPSHASVNRLLTNGEAERVARLASASVHQTP